MEFCFDSIYTRKDSFSFEVSGLQQMKHLVEVNGEKELEIALKCGAKFIGVNSRNLKTLEVDPKTRIKFASILENYGSQRASS